MMVRGLATYYNAYLLSKVGLGLMTDIRSDVFARLQYLSFSFHDRNSRGKLMTAVIQYTQSLQQLLIQVLNDVVVQPLTLVAAVGSYSWDAVVKYPLAALMFVGIDVPCTVVSNVAVGAFIITTWPFVGSQVKEDNGSASLSSIDSE